MSSLRPRTASLRARLGTLALHAGACALVALAAGLGTRASADDAPKPDEPKPAKPDDAKPDAPKPDAPKPDAPKPDAPKGDKPAAGPPRIACGFTTHVMDETPKEQEGQYHLCEKLAEFGFPVDSLVVSKWDKFLKKSGVTVIDPAAPAPKDAKDAPKPDYTLEATLDLHYKPTTFMGKTQAHNYLAKVDAKLKDAKGTVVQTISFEHYAGATIQSKQDEVEKMVESQAYRFLICKFLKLEQVASAVPQPKKVAYDKFVGDEDKYTTDNLKAPPKGLK